MTPGEGLALYFDVIVWDSLSPLSRWVKSRFQSLVFSIKPFSLGTAFEIGKTSLSFVSLQTEGDPQRSTDIDKVYQHSLHAVSAVRQFCLCFPLRAAPVHEVDVQFSTSDVQKWQLLELSKCPFFHAFSMSAVPAVSSCPQLSPADTTSPSARICYHLSACLAGGQYIWCTPVTPVPAVDALKKSAVHLGALELSLQPALFDIKTGRVSRHRWQCSWMEKLSKTSELVDAPWEQSVDAQLMLHFEFSMKVFRPLRRSTLPPVIVCFWVRIIQHQLLTAIYVCIPC